MIAYYFGGKRGLYEAMFDATYRRLVERMQSFLAAPAQPSDDPIGWLVELQIRTLADTPWLPPLIVREVLAREAPLRGVLRRAHREGARRAGAGALAPRDRRGPAARRPRSRCS